MITIKTREDIEVIRQNGKIVAKTLDLLRKSAVSGVKTEDLNGIADKFIRDQGAISASLGYKGFPKSICISINEEVVHGISSERKLEEGQIVTFDVCILKNRLHADAAITIPVGNVSEKVKKLIDICEKSLDAGIEKVIAGNRFSHISFAVHRHIKSNGYSVIRGYGGHGIGKELHEDPFIPNYYCQCKELGPIIQNGMVFTIEPMISAGKRTVRVLDNKWTVVTKDKSLSAHCEHTIAIVDGKPEILTKL